VKVDEARQIFWSERSFLSLDPLPSHNMKADTPANVLTRELAQYLDRADSQGISKKTQAQCFRDTLQRLEKLRPNARPAEIQRIFNVGAWYQLFGWPPKLPSWAEPSDAQVFAGSRIVSALVNLHKDWKRADTLPKVRRPTPALYVWSALTLPDRCGCA
jgi:hypothetical protein